MPENFSDRLGNWKSSAKDTYRRTTLVKAQAELYELLGSQTLQLGYGLDKIEDDPRMVKIMLQRIFGRRQTAHYISDRKR